MIIDCNAFWGRWGLRSKGIYRKDEFFRMMRENGIVSSLVTSTTALVTDTRGGNEELMQSLGDEGEKVIPLACMNPFWGLNEAVSWLDKGFRTWRLYPNLHSYRLTDTALLDPFMKRIRERTSFICITLNVEPNFSAMANSIGFDTALHLDDLSFFAHRYSSLKMLVSGYAPEYHQVRLAAALLKKNPNLYIETSNWFQSGMVEEMVRQAGADNILFGSASGILNAGPSVMKISCSNVTEEARHKIFHDNAAGLLKNE